jgi:hypothetical protein
VVKAWQTHLQVNGVVRTERADQPLTQSPIADEAYASVLVSRDPDNIQPELSEPAATSDPRHRLLVRAPRIHGIGSNCHAGVRT